MKTTPVDIKLIANYARMRALFLVFGIVTAVGVILISFSGMQHENGMKEFYAPARPISPEFKWTQVAPPGSGTHQFEWKPGTYPSAICPLAGTNNDLWMIGQKNAWSSLNGIKWEAHDKYDWGEKISMAYVSFKNKFWVLGGMEYASNTFLNDIWSSSDGKNWNMTIEHAEWSPRKGHTVVEFENKLWLFGGAIGVDKDKSPNKYVNDIWSSTDGIRWTNVLEACPWVARDNPRILAFKGKLWMVGGQGHSDIWSSSDGKNWTQSESDVPWKGRYDYGALVYDNLIWVFGGRDSDPRNAYRDVWYSIDGSHWRLQTDNAPWSPRSGGNSVVYKDKLWLYGGKHTGHEDSFSGDIWTMEPIYKE